MLPCPALFPSKSPTSYYWDYLLVTKLYLLSAYYNLSIHTNYSACFPSHKKLWTTEAILSQILDRAVLIGKARFAIGSVGAVGGRGARWGCNGEEYSSGERNG